MTTQHYFGSTFEAYTAAQTIGDIKDGDILVVLNEGVVGYLAGAWPVAVTTARGHFHGIEYVPIRYRDAAIEGQVVAQKYDIEFDPALLTQ